ncbi:MAG: Nitrilase/cyanide hydratase and apolipoprotein N-acyltransferase [Frankiales bacterium]|nr:Nitrilase/cyanide hydratase and apolipoprotein N-acyltransferase [Frankiales bacterium]
MSFRLAAVQPRAFSDQEEERNLEAALRWLQRASEAGADLVVFPEGYPGPTNPANEYDSLGPLRATARELGLHVVAGGLAPADDGKHYVTSFLIDDDGEIAGAYRRTTPLGPYIYRDIPAWNFDYEASAEAPRVFSTRLGRIGILTCSEVYVPELSRTLALQGADLIVYPAGGAINELLPTWRTMIWARAIENLTYTAAVQNLYASDEEGVATIASPEAVVASSLDEALLISEVDTDRLAFLRERDEHIEFPKPYRTIPGVIRWRRPELYSSLVDSTMAPGSS